MKRNRPALVLASLMSGALSGILFVNDSSGLSTYGLGSIFGLVLAVYYRITHHIGLGRQLLLVSISSLAWYVALQSFVFSSGGDYTVTSFLLAGLIGSLMLGLAARLLIRSVTWNKFWIIPVTGVVTASFMDMLLSGADDPSTFRYIVSFIIWQAGMALVLA